MMNNSTINSTPNSTNQNTVSTVNSDLTDLPSLDQLRLNDFKLEKQLVPLVTNPDKVLLKKKKNPDWKHFFYYINVTAIRELFNLDDVAGDEFCFYLPIKLGGTHQAEEVFPECRHIKNH
jgi:hypothetical protein